MAYKNISLSTEAYETLRRHKRADESFTQEVLRLLSKPSISEVAGILSNDEAKELQAGVKLVREAFKVRKWQ